MVFLHIRRFYPREKKNIPSSKHTKSYGKSPFLMGKSTISMAIFNSFLYVYQRVNSLIDHKIFWNLIKSPLNPNDLPKRVEIGWNIGIGSYFFSGSFLISPWHPHKNQQNPLVFASQVRSRRGSYHGRADRIGFDFWKLAAVGNVDWKIQCFPGAKYRKIMNYTIYIIGKCGFKHLVN